MTPGELARTSNAIVTVEMMLESIDRRFIDLDRRLDERAKSEQRLLDERALAQQRLLDERASASQRAIEALSIANEKALVKVDEKTEKSLGEIRGLIAGLQSSQSEGDGRRMGVSTLAGAAMAGLGTAAVIASVVISLTK